MQSYDRLFAEHDIVVAQTLLTRHDLADRLSYLNARNTLLALLHYKVVPIVNENDAVAVEELAESRIGENDTLGALTANLVDADLLVILITRDGLFTADPKLDPGATLIRRVERIDATVEAYAGGSDTSGTGGMVTKLQAARLATAGGADVVGGVAAAEKRAKAECRARKLDLRQRQSLRRILKSPTTAKPKTKSPASSRARRVPNTVRASGGRDAADGAADDAVVAVRRKVWRDRSPTSSGQRRLQKQQVPSPISTDTPRSPRLRRRSLHRSRNPSSKPRWIARHPHLRRQPLKAKPMRPKRRRDGARLCARRSALEPPRRPISRR